MTHYSLVHKFIPMPQALKIPDAKAAMEKQWEKPEKIPAWQLTKVRDEKGVIDEARKNGRKVRSRELERLARRVEQHSQRMAELLRRGVLEPSVAYAFLMTKAKLGQAARRRQVKELRLPLTRHRHVSRQKDRPWCSRGAKRWNPLMLVRRYELRDEPDALSSAGHCRMAPAQG